MPELPHRVRIERTLDESPAAVWAVLADFANIADWNGGVTTSHATGSHETVGVGAQRHCDLAPMGELEETVLVWEPDQRMVISIDSAKRIPVKRGEMTFEMSPADGGTAFVLDYGFQAKGGPIAPLVGRMLTGQLEKGFSGFIDDLAAAAANPTAA
ncbi:MAG: SRPBCC family protein [Actinomycetota bacterium]